MKPALFLRIASIVALLQFGAHTFLLASYVPTHGPEEVALVTAMKSHLFNFGGFANHSYWDMYFGYGLFAAFNCLIEALLFWLLAALANFLRIRPIIALFCVANLGYAVLVWKYFFIKPLVADVAIAICLAVAFVSSRGAGSVEAS